MIKNFIFGIGEANTEEVNLTENNPFKGNVERLTAHGAEFEDGSHRNFSVVIYATGKLINSSTVIN